MGHIAPGRAVGAIAFPIPVRKATCGTDMYLATFIREQCHAADCYWLRFLSDFRPFSAQ